MKSALCPLCGGQLCKDPPPNTYKFEYTCKKCGAGYFADSEKILSLVLGSSFETI